MSQRGGVRQWRLALLCVVLGSLYGGPALAESTHEEPILQAYQRFLAQTTVSHKAVSFYLSSTEKRGFLQAHLMLVIDEVSFTDFVDALHHPAHWCEFIPLHPNVKACTYHQDGERNLVTMYLGTKAYQVPEDAKVLAYEFTAIQSQNRFDVQLRANDGPYGTSDHHIRLDAVPVEGGVFVRLHMSQRLGFARFAIKVYLAIQARHKIGFSRIDTDQSDHPKYVRGLKAMIERNVVRYILALKVWFEVQQLPEENRFERRLHRWFDETERYKEQLHELSKSDYLDAKHRERSNQQRLQQAIADQ